MTSVTAKPRRRWFKFSLRTLFVVVTVAGIAMCGVLCFDRLHRNWNIVSPDSWPPELRQLTSEARAAGDDMVDIEVRYGGNIIDYYWKTSMTESRLKAHMRQFKLQAVQPGGVEEATLRRWLPDAWPTPSDKLDAYAFPPGSARPPEGGHLFVLLHDKKQQQLYFYYYLDF